MPNWCYNELTIEGDEKVIAKLLSMVQTEHTCFDFDSVIPYPPRYAEADAIINDEWPNGGKGYNAGGHEWCIMNWGTKWGAYEPSVDVGVTGKVATFRFDTAWSPSLPVTEALAVAFPELTFTHKYEEGGCDFSGVEVYEDGQVKNSAGGAYDDYPITEHPKYDENGDELEV